MNGTAPIIARALKSFRGAVKHLYWQAYGLVLVHPPVPPSPRSLLFVCKGNICRSPFAEALARKYIPDENRIVCRSAGIVVGSPESCPRETLTAAERFGIDLSGHRSRSIDAELLAASDMTLAMEAWQARHLRRAFPGHRDKVFLLPLFGEGPPDQGDPGRLLNIRDPYGRGLEDFIECFERIDACIQGVFAGVRDGTRAAAAGITQNRPGKEP
jgi:protein-tyrosine phosphatase